MPEVVDVSTIGTYMIDEGLTWMLLAGRPEAGSDSAMCDAGSVINHVARTLEDDIDRVLVASMLVMAWTLLEQLSQRYLQFDDTIIDDTTSQGSNA